MSLNYLIDIAEVTRYIQGKGYDVNSTANLEENLKLFRASAHKKICNYLGYEILSTSYTDELHFGDGTHFLYLLNRPVTTITSVKSDEASNNTSNFEIFNNRALYYKNGFFNQSADWKISYTAGYTRTTMPGDIREAALQLMYLSGQASGPKGLLGLSSYSQPEGSGITVNPEALNEVLFTLESYRMVRL